MIHCYDHHPSSNHHDDHLLNVSASTLVTPSETEIAKACAVVDANADHRVDNKVTMTMVMMKMTMTIMKGPSDNDDDDDDGDYDYFHARVTLVSAAWSTQALSPPKTQRVTTCQVSSLKSFSDAKRTCKVSSWSS